MSSDFDSALSLAEIISMRPDRMMDHLQGVNLNQWSLDSVLLQASSESKVDHLLVLLKNFTFSTMALSMALDTAARTGNYPIVVLLREAKAPIYPQQVVDHPHQIFEHFALQSAYNAGQHAVEEYLKQSVEIEKFLTIPIELFETPQGKVFIGEVQAVLQVDHSAKQLLQKGLHQQLIAAVKNNNIPAIHEVITRTTAMCALDAVNDKTKRNIYSNHDKTGVTPLCYAIGTGHLEIVKLLLNEPIYINHLDASGSTALHLALKKICYPSATQEVANKQEYLDIVHLLLKNNAKVNVVDSTNVSTLDLICELHQRNPADEAIEQIYQQALTAYSKERRPGLP